ncbi:hypothetical protein Vadar_025523 [Vaccinium darrowii]|uniref:Uncharacterized protein n=1 Tax=Vaccinium darrowii TaxID=229202 RepID=A0ACB7Z7K0_9ERIC|nr:hypothetical protein Vadar_025523 [Vaccinium darrowii]
MVENIKTRCYDMLTVYEGKNDKNHGEASSNPPPSTDGNLGRYALFLNSRKKGEAMPGNPFPTINDDDMDTDEYISDHGFLPEKRTDGFNPKAYKLLANSGYDFNNPAPLGELSPEITGEKIHSLSKAQKELRRQGHKVSPSKTGLGFTPPQPVYISAKGKSKKANVQHITIEEVEEDDNQQSSPRVSVFDRIEAPGNRTSVFDRLGVTKETRKESTLQIKKSIFSRLGNRSISSKGENIKGKGKSIEIDSSKGDEETRSSIPSRMKRITSLDVDTEGPLKVKRCTIVLTGQHKGQAKVAKEEEMEYTTSYHVEVEEHSSSDFEDDDFPEAPPQLEDGGQPTVDDLKELNLGTPDEPRPIFDTTK